MRPTWFLLRSLISLIAVGLGVTDRAFIVQIHYDNALVCTASLLSARLIITAAHCFPNNSPWWKFYVLTRAGSKSNNLIDDRQIHYKYSKHNFLADIAVARLRLPIKRAEVPYAKLCTKPLKIGATVTVSAFERHGNTFESNPLLSANLSIISFNKCNKLLDIALPSNTICAGGNTNNTICLGDSGGAMVYNGELCGIKSWAYDCENGVKPNILMSIAYYDIFIKKAIQELSRVQKTNNNLPIVSPNSVKQKKKSHRNAEPH